MMLDKASAGLETLGKNIYTRKTSQTNIHLFKVNNKNAEKILNMFKVNSKDTRTTFNCICC